MARCSSSCTRSRARCTTTGNSTRSASGSGQQLALIQRFVETTNRGTEEQFVTAFVLLARSLGVDARVATGFVVPPDELEFAARPAVDVRRGLAGGEAGRSGLVGVRSEAGAGDERRSAAASAAGGAEPGGGAATDRPTRRSRQRRTGRHARPSNPGQTTGRRSAPGSTRGTVVGGIGGAAVPARRGWHRRHEVARAGGGVSAPTIPPGGSPARGRTRPTHSSTPASRSGRRGPTTGSPSRAPSWHPPRRTRCAGWPQPRRRSRSAMSRTTGFASTTRSPPRAAIDRAILR